jgi:serine/threonine protein kinase
MVGKQSYVSPEQFRGKAVPASDLYSLAATLYFLLSGQDPEPLTPSSPSGIVTVSEGTSRFIIGAMSLNPKERPVSARMFAKEARFLIAPPLIAS